MSLEENINFQEAIEELTALGVIVSDEENYFSIDRHRLSKIGYLLIMNRENLCPEFILRICTM